MRSKIEKPSKKKLKSELTDLHKLIEKKNRENEILEKLLYNLNKKFSKKNIDK